jgi:hypothetical protein
MPVNILHLAYDQFIFFLSFIIENKAIGVMKTGHSFTIEPMINAGTITEFIVYQSGIFLL